MGVYDEMDVPAASDNEAVDFSGPIASSADDEGVSKGRSGWKLLAATRVRHVAVPLALAVQMVDQVTNDAAQHRYERKVAGLPIIG